MITLRQNNNAFNISKDETTYVWESECTSIILEDNLLRFFLFKRFSIILNK